MSSSTRLHALDGVRGVAALVVVFYHLSLVAAPVLKAEGARAAWELATETPVKLVFAGTEAVLVFFVLSGLVVTLPALRPGFSWAGFLASRAVRLYLPVWGSLLLAALLIALVPRDRARVSDGAWITDANAQAIELPALLREASLTPATYDIVNVLWSLRWELVFTLLLPVFVAVGVLLRRHVLVAGLVSLAATVLGRVVEIDALVYLPVFLLGTLIAVRLDDLRTWAAQRPRHLLWVSTAAVSSLLLIASWITRPVVEPGSDISRVLWGLAGVGAVGLIIATIGSPLLDGALRHRVPQWLGRVSFSLYLVHVPVIATLTFALGDELWWLVLVIGVPLSLVGAELFYRAVERPSHGLARRVGARVSAASARVSGRETRSRARDAHALHAR